LRDELVLAGLRATRALGQNFLLDLNLLDSLVRDIPLQPGDTVYEVGPGPGGLTRALLKAGAKVVAVERDTRAHPILERLAAAVPGQLEVIAGDALAMDEARLVPPGAHIAANLPYNIATQLLVRWLSVEPWPPWWLSATLMFQREVAERIVAAPGTDAYGRLSVLAAFHSRARILRLLPARAFTPAPKVESAVVQLVPAAPLADVPVRAVARLTALAFGQRRKMLRQSLKAFVPELQAAGIDPARRPETLAPVDYARLAQLLSGRLLPDIPADC
jgi:16S rRNA (adenine1518-N6/adenine1519-N6)-dimethyltransferase